MDFQLKCVNGDWFVQQASMNDETVAWQHVVSDLETIVKNVLGRTPRPRSGRVWPLDVDKPKASALVQIKCLFDAVNVSRGRFDVRFTVDIESFNAGDVDWDMGAPECADMLAESDARMAAIEPPAAESAAPPEIVPVPRFVDVLSDADDADEAIIEISPPGRRVDSGVEVAIKSGALRGHADVDEAIADIERRLHANEITDARAVRELALLADGGFVRFSRDAFAQLRAEACVVDHD